MADATVFDDEPPPEYDDRPRRRASSRGNGARVPPHNLDAERALLGALLLSRDAVAAAAEVIPGADVFYRPAHAHIYEAVSVLTAKGEVADPITVADELRRRDLLDGAGGTAALVDLQADAPGTANAAHYARIVRDHSLLRRLIGAAGSISETAYGVPEDVRKVVDEAESLVFDIARHEGEGSTARLTDLLGDTLTRIEELHDRGSEITGTPTGYHDLDEMTAGLQPGALVVVGARPAMGKTALALGMAANAALRGDYAILLFSLEMSKVELVQRILCADARVDSTKIRNGRLSDPDWNAIAASMGRLGDAKIWIDDNPNVSIMEIRSKARRLRSEIGQLDMVVVDYIQLMTGRTNAESRQVEVAEISRGLKLLARELECPVVALAQLNRGLEQRADKRPMLSDLRESGCLTSGTRLLRADTNAEVTLGELLESGARDVPVWTLDDRFRLVPSTLTHAFPSGTKPVVRMRLASGRVIEATESHLFRTLDGWTPLGDLAVGSRIAVPRQIESPEQVQPVDPDELVLLARSAQKFVPDVVHAAPTDQVRTFLRNLWATDGTIGVNRTGEGPRVRLVYTTTSRRLADDVQRLLLRCGVQSRISVVPQGRHRPAHHVRVDGVDHQRRFLTDIGIHGERGTEVAPALTALEGVVANANVDTIPFEVRPQVVAAMAEAGITQRQLAARLGEQYCGSYLLGSASRPRSMRRARLLSIAEITEDKDLADLATSDVLWDSVVELEPLGEHPVYDATVLGTHCFVANGIVAHNSLEQDADVVMFLYRDEVYEPTPENAGLAEIIVAKQRNGPTGVAHLSFLGHLTRFESMARDV
ncbi:MAG: replicative DNA helicase [Iamia sp.]